jgi:DNA-directed RNA polymerase subunit RPC12/RpoP
MGIFNKKPRKPEEGQSPAASFPASGSRADFVQQMKEQARQLQAQAQAMQAQAMQQAAAFGQATDAGAAGAAGSRGGAGPMSWARQVMSILAPPQPGFVKRCTCVTCGAPKQLPSATAYVYCDYCASLVDFDLRQACEGDTLPGPEYVALVNSSQAASQAAVAAGDRDGYRAIQERIFSAYVANVPMAVSHRARNDQGYRQAYVRYMAEAAVARAFDPAYQVLEAEMRQRVMGLRYTGNMLSPTVDPDSFWPMAGTLEKQIELSRAHYRSGGFADIDPDRGEHLLPKMAWSGFCQGWLGMLPTDAAARLLQQTGLTSEYVPVAATRGQPRHCGGCGAEFTALPGANAIVCEGCGRTMHLGDAEIPCASCGAAMTLPAGADETSCPFCQSLVRRAGIF